MEHKCDKLQGTYTFQQEISLMIWRDRRQYSELTLPSSLFPVVECIWTLPFMTTQYNLRFEHLENAK